MNIAIIGDQNGNGNRIAEILSASSSNTVVLYNLTTDFCKVSSHFKPARAHCSSYTARALPIGDGYSALCAGKHSLLFSIILSFIFFTKIVFLNTNSEFFRPYFKHRTLKKAIFHELSQYDRIIASGTLCIWFTPDLLSKTLFIPYSIGVEYLSSLTFELHSQSKNLVLAYCAKKLAKLQAVSLEKVAISFSSDIHTNNILSKVGSNVILMPVPIVPSESLEFLIPSHIQQILDYANDKFIVLLGSRHFWSSVSNSGLPISHSKRNNLIFEALALLENSSLGVHIIAPEYGSDVNDSKEYALSLGLEEMISWVPKLQQTELVGLINFCTVGIGEFYSEPTMFGGFGYEVLSRNKFLINGGSLVFYKRIFEQLGCLHPSKLLLANEAAQIASSIELSCHLTKQYNSSNHEETFFLSQATNYFNNTVLNLSSINQ